MSSWTAAQLGDLVSFKAGSAFPKEFQGRTSGELPFAKVSDMNRAGNEVVLQAAENWLDLEDVRRMRVTIHEPGSVAFAKIGIALTYNRRRKIIRPTILDNNMMSAKTKTNRIRTDFLYYLLMTIDFNDIASGSALPYLTVGNLKTIEASLPPPPEQKTIAAILGALDDKIELNRQIRRTLEAVARALFRSWFVDFDPVRAKAEGSAPAHMGAATADLFPARFGDDGLPEGWRLGKLADLMTVKSGKRPPDKSSKPTIEHSIPVFGGNGVCWYTTDHLFDQAFIITGRVGTLGTVFRVYEKCWVSDNALCCIPANEGNFEFLYFAIKAVDFDSLNSGSTQPLLTQSSLIKQAAVMAPKSVLLAFHRVASDCFGKVEQLDRQNHTLAALRDTLLPKLMSGELRVRDAERMLAEAV